MADPGWCNDPSDTRLARWFDGEHWTKHTIVKADWKGPGAPPPPVDLERVTAFPTTEAIPIVPLQPTGPLPPPPLPPTALDPPTALSRAGERYRGWPLWGRIAGPVVAVFVVLSAIGATQGDDGEPVSAGDPSSTSSVVRRTTSTSEATTTTTAVTTTDAPVTTAAPLTTKALAPVTTKKASPPTTAPPATAPPATQPPATQPPTTQPAPSCDPNYSGCLDPNASDYDCEGGSGDGPKYTGPVQVLGNDHYGLDSDHDGMGCESS